MIQGAIFDVDGTLLDSMIIWQTVGEQYLRAQGIVPRENLAETFKTMSLQDAAAHFIICYHVPLSLDEIMDGINAMVEDFYRHKAQPKPGVAVFLQELERRNIPMCIATATDRYLVEAALERCNLLHYFRDIFTCTQVGSSKTSPEIYRQAAACLGFRKENVWVFEDAIHAACTAGADSFPVAGIYDPAEENQQALQDCCQVYLKSFEDTCKFWKFASL